MRFLYAKLNGYIGLYNGLGLSEIEINFAQAKNKICVVSGPNGVGKSTLLNALSIMPDSNDCFVPSLSASKYLKLTDGKNIYEIFIVHPLDKNGNRSVSKASFKKNGAELNPNGNISSYKDLVQDEFELDSNYTVLSKVSSGNRGLADKKPAERKKILSSLISSLEVYNEIYKNLNKKANIYKSYLNNTSSKIQNIGDEKYLKATKESLENKINEINKILDDLKERITESRTLVAIVDKDGSKQRKYEELSSKLDLLKGNADIQYTILSKALGKTDDIDIKNIDKDLDNAQNILNNYKASLEKLEIEDKNIVSNMSEITSDIDKINIQLNGLEDSDESLKPEIDKYEKANSDLLKELSDIGINNIDATSKEEIDFVISYVNSLIESIDSLYEFMQDGDLDNMMKNQNYDSIIKSNELQIQESSSLLENLKRDLKISEKINNRPKNCKIDDCPFIKDALSLDSPAIISKNISKLEIKIDECYKSIENCRRYLSESAILMGITSGLKSNHEILLKFRITSHLTDMKTFLELISRQYRFNEYRDLTKYLSISNDIIIYKQNCIIINNLKSSYAIQENNKSIIKKYKSDLADKEERLKKYKDKYTKITTDESFTSSLINKFSEKIERLTNIKYSNDKYIESKEIYESAYSEAEEIKKEFSNSLKELEKIDELQNQINRYTSQLEPLQSDLKNVESQLSLLDSFKKDYKEYNSKYGYIDTLRKYASPTQGNIQSLFMSLYMDKTLTTVNNLLGMIFNGEYKILEYVINENEFRIPFIGNGLAVDDISNGSTSQVCIMGMIINLVLYTMGSNKFGIVSLDEIDSGLDQANRYMFVDVLQKICGILNIDQLFIISHSVESALDFVDVILLSEDPEYMDLFKNANIIYKYSKH